MLQRATTTRQQTSSQQQVYPQLNEGSVTAVAPFALPIHAEVGGEQVRILAAGNVLGMSPAYLVVDDAGNSQWVSLEETTIIDPNFLPIQSRARKQK